MAVSEGAWSHSHKDVTHYFSSNVDGHFELFDAENFSRLYRVTARMTPDHSPDTHIIKGDGGSSTIIAIPELDNEDSPYLSLHLGTKDGGFSIWQPFAGEREVTDLFELANGLFAVRLDKSDWQLIRVKPNGSSQRVTLPSLPSEVPKIRKLTDGLFGVAIYDDALRRDKDDGALWHLFRINSGDEIEPLQLSGFEPGAVKSIHRISDHLLRLTSRTSEDVDHSLQTHFYRINESKQAIEVHKDITGIPDLTRNFRLLANGELVGAAEVDDADGDGTPGDWVWRMRDSQGEWRTPQEILPELSGKIWTMSDWHDGQGIGVQTMTGESGAEYTSQWYLRDNKTKQWHSAEKTLPLHDDLAIDTIHERRDGLFEITSMLDAAIKPDFDSPVPVVIQSTHWVMRAEDGEWNDVRSIVAKHRPGLEKKIIAVDARSNGLMVDIQRNHDETPIRLLFYKNRDHQWVMLDNTMLTTASSSAASNKRPFSKVKHSEVLASGRLILLHEQDDANWDGESGDIQLLQSGSEGWRLLQAQNALGGKAAQLRYDADLGLLVRSSHTGGSKHYFRLDHDGSWTDVRTLIPNAPAELASAFTFANSRGVAIKEQLDANGNGRFGEWYFYYPDSQGWHDISTLLPNAFPAIQTIIDAGGRSTISVQEAGDANRNEIANEWHHYYRNGDQWIDLQQQWPELPEELSELRVSADGRVLTAREEWDSNGNGESFELIAAIWSDKQHRFIPVSTLIEQPLQQISDIRSLWSGRGIAIQVSNAEQTSSITSSTTVAGGHRWLLYQHQTDENWKPVVVGDSAPLEIRADSTGRLLALRTESESDWQLWSRSSPEASLSRVSEYTNRQLKDVQLEIATGLFAIQLSDLWRDGSEQWELWKLNDGGHERVGHSSSSSWFGLNHTSDSQDRIHFDNAQHYQDGRQVENVATPKIWFHADANIPNQKNTVYAPAVISQALTSPDGITPPVRIDAIGYGPSGSVIVYMNGTQRMVVSSSNGPSWMESRTELDDKAASKKEIILLVNRFPDGTERLSRLDAPDLWIWSYNHQNGRIYYDNNGYFFNETDAVSEVLTFRVGEQIHAFEQLGSYLFRPDILEKRLGLAERTLFGLTQRDAERIKLAKKLAPEGIDIASLQPPHITVVASTDSVDHPYVDLDLTAEGFGIDESSISIHILGAGQARSVTPQPSGDQRQKLALTKRVPLVPGVNRLKVSIYDANGLSHSQRLQITYTPIKGEKPTLYAAIVATSQYKGVNNLDALPLTQNDARTITETLKSQHGKRFGKVVTQTWCQEDGCNSQPTRKQLIEQLPQFLSSAKNGDFVVIYISGHGLKIGSEYFMVPEDGDPALPSTLVAWSQIQGWLRGTGLGKKVVFLDTCQSGAVFKQNRDQRRMVQQAAEHDGIYVLSAAAADASAYELSSIGNGLFTHVVKEGLIGQADAGADGSISFEELSFHIARRVRELSSAQKVRMEPYVPILDQHMDFEFANVNRKIALYLRTSDISTFDNTALPTRNRWWGEQINNLKGNISLANRERATHTLAIVEDNGTPMRSQLSSNSGNVLGQWRFSDTGVEVMLQEVSKTISESQKVAVACSASAAKGAKRKVKCD